MCAVSVAATTLAITDVNDRNASSSFVGAAGISAGVSGPPRRQGWDTGHAPSQTLTEPDQTLLATAGSIAARS